jgi:hypothetical protein
MATVTATAKPYFAPQGKLRRILETGRAPTASEIGCTDRKEFRYLHPRWDGKITHWFPCAKRKSHDQEGVVFAFRILPALTPGLNDHPGATSLFQSGRGQDGSLHPNTIRRTGIIDNFGSTRPVSFIPTLPFVPDNQNYPAYSSPADNPYQLLRAALWEKGSRLKKEWMPLIMLPGEIDEYRQQVKMKSTHRSEPLLPMPRQRFFAYALIYRGHNPVAGKDFTFEQMPYGILPEHGLQIVSFNEQVYRALQKQYRNKIESEGPDQFLHPDPAAPEQGALNYIWNPKFPNPVNGEDGGDKIGYDAVVSRYYYDAPNRKHNVDLKLPVSFLDWYYRTWEPWSETLNGIHGTEQVHLLARFFPELKGPCAMAWQNHPTLMAAWKEAFKDAPDQFDFFSLLQRKYGEDWDGMEDETREETNRKTSRRESRLNYEPSSPGTDEQGYDMPDNDASDEVPEDESPYGESFPVESEPVPATERVIAARSTVLQPGSRGMGPRTPRNPVRPTVGAARLTIEDFGLTFDPTAGDTDEESNVF